MFESPLYAPEMVTCPAVVPVRATEHRALLRPVALNVQLVVVKATVPLPDCVKDTVPVGE